MIVLPGARIVSLDSLHCRFFTKEIFRSYEINDTQVNICQYVT